MSEKEVVGRLLEELEKRGWRRANECPREGEVVASPILNEVFEGSFRKLNEKALVNEGLGDKVDDVLGKVRDEIIKSEPYRFLEHLREGLFVPEGRKLVHVTLIDYENIDNNVFMACRNVAFPGEVKPNKPDVVLYINGIPVLVIEAKDPFRLGERAISEGYNQLLRYERESPDLFKYVQIGVVYTTDDNSIYMPMSSVYRGKDRWYGRWRDPNDKPNILDLLDRPRVLDILRWYTFYKGPRKDEKVVPRYNQYWATVKAIDRVTSYLERGDERNKGLIWQWQGSGKTYIMFYIAYQFFKRFYNKDPIVFFIVDRRELQRQLHDEFIKDIYAEDFQEYVKTVESIEELKDILRDIKERELKGQSVTRGTYVSLVQKFRPEDFKDLQPIRKREILVLLDEAHRSLYGMLGATLNKLLPNALKFAFTGTPVMGYERNTFSLFAYPKRGEYYLHRYSIMDSIRDGYTLPLKYQAVQEIENVKINVSQEEIKELLESWLKYASDVRSLDDSDVRSLDDLVDEEAVAPEEIKKRLNKIKVFLENENRLRQIAEYIADRIKEDTEDFRFKAIIVTASRRACVRMKRALDEALVKRSVKDAEDWSEVLMTYTNNDPEEIRNYMNELLNKWRGPEGVKDWEEVNRRIQEKFKDDDYPRILIVTDMLITGFDFPRLKVMYLDKPLYEHRLLQAIARVNRPYRHGDVEKQFGLIVDFVGLMENVKEALKKYELIDKETHSELFERGITGLHTAYDELARTIKDIKQRLAKGLRIGEHEVRLNVDDLITRAKQDKNIYEELEHVALVLAQGYVNYDLEALKLMSDIRRAQHLYQALGAFEEKLDFHDDLVMLLKLYQGVMHYARGVGLPEGFWRDLLKLVHERTTIPNIGLADELTIDLNTLEEVLKRVSSLQGDLQEPKAMKKAMDVAAEALLTVRGFLDLEPANPVYEVIYERLKELEEEWRTSRALSKKTIDELTSLIREVISYRKEREALSLVERLKYDIKRSLSSKFQVSDKNIKLDNTERIIQEVIEKYKGVRASTFYERDRKNLRTALLQDLFNTLKGVSPEDVKQVAYNLASYIEGEVLHELQERH
jgi:type I restriction enzyme R subunit